MSQRATDMMLEEMDIMGPVRMKDVHAAQQRIVEVVGKLEEDGIITLGAGSGERHVV
jgi:flagellar motor switch protein FliG